MVHTDSIVNSATIIPSGTVIELISNDYVDQVEFVKVTSTFLYRGKYNNFEKTYSNHEEPDYIIKVIDNNVLDVLKTRKYLKFAEKINVGDELLFKLKTKKYYSGFDTVCRMITKRKIYSAYKHTLKEVGEVIYDSAKDEILEGKNEVLGNPVTDFIKKIGST
jgi:fatty acid synthase subunit beta